MALKSSGFCGTNTLHELKGCLCDLCGKDADSETTEVVAMDCSFKSCPAESCLYHQACLEKYLKSIKCERNRKIGFPCPRGCGKATKYSASCPGKILKSHPISIRGEANKKRRQAELESLQRTNSNEKDAPAAAKSQKKEEVKPARKESSTGSSPDDKDKSGKGKLVAVSRQASVKALNVSSTKLTTASSSSSSIASIAPKSAAAAKKEQLAAAARNLKNEIAARTGAAKVTTQLVSTSSTASLVAHSSKAKEVKTLDEYLAERGSSALERATSSASAASLLAAPASNAWAAKSRVSSASSLATDTAPQSEASTSILDSEGFPPPPATSAAAVPSGSGRPPVPLPRTPSSTAAATSAGAPAVPAPVQPPPPRGAWAQKQPAVMVIVPPPPPPPRGASVPPSPSGAKAAAGQPLQQETVAQQEAQEQQHPAHPKLSKSQRKNLRRAEKKASGPTPASGEATGHVSHDGSADASQGSSHAAGAATAAAGRAPTTPRNPSAAGVEASPAPPAAFSSEAATGAARSSPSFHSAQHAATCCQPPPPPPVCAADTAMVEPCGDLLDRCLQLVVQHKLQKQVEALAALGFPAGAALAAVQQHGGNLEAAVTTLLEQATGMCDTVHSLGLAGGPLPEVDLSEELALMQALQCMYRLAPGVLETAVVDCNGDLEATAHAVAEQCGDASSSDGSSSTVAGPELLGSSLFEASQAVGHSPHHAFPPPAFEATGSWPWMGPPSPYMDAATSGGGGDMGSDSGGSGMYSAFSFGGFTEAALHAVHGPFGGPFGGVPGPARATGGGGSSACQSLFSSLDNASLGGGTPRHNPLAGLQGMARSGLGLWAVGQPTSPHAHPPADSPLYAQQLSGVWAGHHFSGEVAPGLSPFDRPTLAMSPTGTSSFPRHELVADDKPSGGLFTGMAEQHGWGASWGGGGSGASYGYFDGHHGLPQQGMAHAAPLRDLSDLMSTLLCR